MRTYIDIIFNPDSVAPAEVVRALMKIGISPIMGPHDFCLDWHNQTEFNSKLLEIHRMLQALKVSYRLQTHEYEESASTP